MTMPTSHHQPTLSSLDNKFTGDIGEQEPRIVIGVCAMDKKAKSNPMKEILQRLNRYKEFEIRIFGDEMILNRSVEEWPICDCLFSWHSGNFPLAKAERYVAMREPFVINDVSKQKFLRDRRRVYAMLKEVGIPLPKHIIVNREDVVEGGDPEGFVETPDYVEMNGVTIMKPFVEKPVSGDDHNIHIYYPQQKGGGVKQLFRKRDNRSGVYLPDHPGTVRRDGSYIYEEFLKTGGTDVKVYTVGTRYAHAEARKSPVVDGVVCRTPEGKEVRFPVVLDPREKEIARNVTRVFGQRVCGFDLLRSEMGSVVCDVNGWSFVKSSHKYYDDAAGILRQGILRKLAPHRLSACRRNGSFQGKKDDSTTVEMTRDPVSFDDLSRLRSKDCDLSQWEELRCVLMVARHGDRTPKQKMKIVVKDKPFLELFEKYKDSKGTQATLKAPAQMQELLDVTRSRLKEINDAQKQELLILNMSSKLNRSDSKSEASDSEQEAKDVVDEYKEKFRIVISVLEAGGHFSGINRKVQLKAVQWSKPVPESSEPPSVTEILLILKHGGTLTHAGRLQAEQFGRHTRTTMYPGAALAEGQSVVYSSDEGRVQTSAAAFAKGLLDLEGNSLTPILVSLVQKDPRMLDSFDKAASEGIQASKTVLYNKMTWSENKRCSMQSPARNMFATTPPSSPSEVIGETIRHHLEKATIRTEARDSDDKRSQILNSATVQIPDNCRELLHKLVSLIQNLMEQLHPLCMSESPDLTEEKRPYSSLSQDPNEWEPPNQLSPCTGERLLLMYDRWRKLLKSFYNPKKDQFDISKIPDIYDSAKYDAIHNSHLDIDFEELYNVSRILGNLVIPSEYGVGPESKLRIGVGISSEILGKLLIDLLNTHQESVATTKNMDHAARKKDCQAGHSPSTDFGESGFIDDFDVKLSPFNGELSKMVRDGGEGEETNSRDSESPREGGHRLCPDYAMNINSPLRHVRTRIYFTSESHIHALMNVLKYCGGLTSSTEKSNDWPAIDEQIMEIPEYDYLSHLVFRLYENPQIPIENEKRFRVEILFSPGAAYNPFDLRKQETDWSHVLPIQPRMLLHRENSLTLTKLTKMLQPFTTERK